MAADIIARGMAAKTAAELDSFEQETAAALEGKADLENGKVPAEQLPSYVDDVEEYASVSAFPAEGETGKIYVALDTGYTYRWSGSDYVQIGGQDLSDYYTKSEADALLAQKQETLVSGQNIKTVAGKTVLGSGDLEVTKADVGLGNADNTSDADKPISDATQIALDLKLDKASVTPEIEVRRLFREEYAIEGDVTGGEIAGPQSVWTEETATLRLVPESGKMLPDSITVTGAAFRYDPIDGVIVLSEAEGEVLIEATCPTLATVVLGVENEGISSGTLTRTDAAVGLGYTTDVTTGVLTSDFDSVFPYKYIHEVTDARGNVFVKIPKHYTKYTFDQNSRYMKTQISNVKGDGYILNPCFKDADGNEIDAICVAKYQATGTKALVSSKTGLPTLNYTTYDEMREGCKANGEGYGMLDYWTWRMLQDLFKIEFATTNAQGVLYARVSGGYAADSGSCDAIGENVSGWNLSNMCMTYRGIENLYGNVAQLCDGLLFDNHKILVCYDYTKYCSDVSSPDYTQVSYQINPTTGEGNTVERGYDPSNPIVWESVRTSGKSYTSYWYDMSFSADRSCPLVGGSYGHGTAVGMWWINAFGSGGAGAPDFGSRMIAHMDILIN